MPNISEEKKRNRNSFVSKKFFLTIPHFDEIENTFQLFGWIQNKSWLEKKYISFGLNCLDPKESWLDG